MRLCLLVMFLWLLTLAPHAGRAADLADEFPRMVGKNAAQLNKEHGATLKALTGSKNDFFGAQPWHVWKLDTPQKETRYVVFCGQHIVTIPGESSGAVYLLSDKGKTLGQWHFSTGWRIDIEAAALSFDEKLQAHIITISTRAVINGRGVAKQYFALLDDKLYFIRMENSKGQILRNNYLSPNLTLGGKLPESTFAGWAALLASPKISLRLAALTYLNGIHMNPANPRTEVFSESLPHAKLAREFRSAESTKKLMREYRLSSNKWLKQAADLAATPLRAEDEY